MTPPAFLLQLLKNWNKMQFHEQKFFFGSSL